MACFEGLEVVFLQNEMRYLRKDLHLQGSRMGDLETMGGRDAGVSLMDMGQKSFFQVYACESENLVRCCDMVKDYGSVSFLHIAFRPLVGYEPFRFPSST